MSRFLHSARSPTLSRGQAAVDRRNLVRISSCGQVALSAAALTNPRAVLPVKPIMKEQQP